MKVQDSPIQHSPEPWITGDISWIHIQATKFLSSGNYGSPAANDSPMMCPLADLGRNDWRGLGL